MLGARGHDINGIDHPEVLASKLAEGSFDCVQLVAYKSIEGIKESAGCLTPALAYKVGKALEKKDVHIAMLGSYFNMMDPNPSVVESGTERFKEYLRFAKDFGSHLVGTETGSYKEDWGYHPDNHTEEALEKVIGIFKGLTNEAERHGVMVGIEGVYNHVVSTPARMKKVLDAIDSNNIQVIFDPVNLVHAGNYQAVNEMIDEVFNLYGDRIVLIHAKDFIFDEGEIKRVPLGEGMMDYPYLMDKLKALKPGIAIIIEELTGDELANSREYLSSLV